MSEIESHHNMDPTWDGEDDETATVTPAFLAVHDRTKEVDLFTNPTILSRLITNRKYSSAIKRVKTHPKEASVWVAMKRKGKDKKAFIQKNLSRTSSISSISSQHSHLSKEQKAIMTDYTFRQLPLHTACSNLLQALSQPSTTNEEMDLETLITRLVVTFPEACGFADHDGKLPLHEAVWHNASPSTISMMLMACPSTIHQRDRFGRTPMDLNHNRSHSGKDKQKVKELLMRGVLFWERARDEAETSMQKTQQQQQQQQQQPTEDQYDDQSVMSKTQSIVSSIEPTSWIKLEKRALRLEQLLAEMYEKNYNLGDMVEELSKERLELQEELELLRKDRHVKGILPETTSVTESLREESDDALAKNNQNNEEVQSASQRRETFLEQQNASLGQEVKELNLRLNDYETQMNRMELIVSSFREEMNANIALNSIPEDNTKSMSSKSAQESLNNLLDALSTGSRFATEKFLAGKVTTLERRLQEEIDAREEHISVSSKENDRLLRENAALQSQLNQMDGSVGSKPKKVKQRAQSDSLPTRDLPEIFHSDDLDEILAGAAAMYGSVSDRSSSKSLPETTSRYNDFKSIPENIPEKRVHQRRVTESAANQEFVVSIEEIYGKVIPPKLKKEISASSLGKAFGEASDETVNGDEPTHADLEKIQSRVLEIERQYGEPIPTDLALAINYCSIVSDLTKTTRGSIANGEDLDAIFREAKDLFGPIDPDFQNAIRQSIMRKDDDPQESQLSQDGLEQICHDVSKKTGGEVPSGFARMMSETFLGTPVSSVRPGPDDSDDPLERVFQNAAKLHGPIKPSLKAAMLETVLDIGNHDTEPSNDAHEELRKSAASVPRPVDDYITPEISTRKIMADKPSPSRTPVLSSKKLKSPVMRHSSDDSSSEKSGLRSIPLALEEPEQPFSGKSRMSATKNTKVKKTSSATRHPEGRDEPLSVDHASDNLDHIFSVASQQSRKTSIKSVDDLLSGSAALKPGLISDKESSSSTEEISDSPSDFDSIIREAEQSYGQPFDRDVVEALRGATFSPKESFATQSNDSDISPEEDLDNIIEEAEKTFGQPFGTNLKAALRNASLQLPGSSSSRNSDIVEDSSRISQGSTESEVADDFSVLDSIIREAEQSYGKPFDASLKEALHGASVNPPESFLAREISGTSGYLSRDDDLESIIEAAERMYGRPFESNLKAALRSASVQPGESFRASDLVGNSLRSQGSYDSRKQESYQQEVSDKVGSTINEVERVYGHRFNQDLKQALRAARSPTGKSLQSIESYEDNDDLESIIRDAEKMYGKPIQSDLKHALRTVSIQPGASFRTLDLIQESTKDEGRFDAMNEAAKMYSKPMLNEAYAGRHQRGGSGHLDIGMASDNLNEIFSEASKDRAMNSQPPFSTKKARSFKPSSLYSIKDDSSLSHISVESDDIDDILMQAAHSYSSNKKS